MNHTKLLFAIGVLVTVLPPLGFPRGIEDSLLVLAGLTIMAVTGWRWWQSRPKSRPLPFPEHKPSHTPEQVTK